MQDCVGVRRGKTLPGTFLSLDCLSDSVERALGRDGMRARNLDELGWRASVDAAVLHGRFDGLQHVVREALWIVGAS